MTLHELIETLQAVEANEQFPARDARVTVTTMGEAHDVVSVCQVLTLGTGKGIVMDEIALEIALPHCDYCGRWVGEHDDDCPERPGAEDDDELLQQADILSSTEGR